jgi:protein-tyrosine phosphatase
MSWFGKKRSSLTSFFEYAPEGLVDIHSHVLPGLDDGARSAAEAHRMLRGLYEMGFVEVVCTPHFQSLSAYPGRPLQEALIGEIVGKANETLPSLRTGAETLFDDLFIKAEAGGSVPTIGNSETYLLELGFGPGSVPAGLEEVSFNLIVKSKRLILAHPERCADLQRDLERLFVLHRSGWLFQLDVLSLTGAHGHRTKQTAYQLLDEGLIDIAATDIHREEDLGEIRAALTAFIEWDSGSFERLFSTTPREILSSAPNEAITHE